MTDEYYPLKGDAFICNSDDYENVHMYLTSEKDDGQLYAFTFLRAEAGVPSKQIEVPVKELKGPFFPSILSHAIKGKQPDEIKKQFKIYSSVVDKIDDILINSRSNSVLISDVISKTTTAEKITPAEVSMVIKILIAEAISYRYKKIESGEYISFSNFKLSSENSKIYYGTLAEEISLKSKQISLLIIHGQTVGNYRELILRSLLKKYLPSKFSVVTGFIEGISRQFDILIIDTHNYSPVFIEGELVVARRESVRAIIEVKTNLDSQNLNDSLELFYDTSRGGIFKPQLPIFKGIFAFDSNYSNTQSIAKRIKDFYTKPYFEEKLQYEITRDIDYLYREITCVCVLNKHFVFSNYENYDGDKNNNIIPTLKSVSDENGLDIQSAMFIASLFRYLDVDYNAKNSTLRSFFDLLHASSVEVKHEMYIPKENWFPVLRSPNEHDSTQETIQQRLKLLDQWFSGKVSSADYIRALESEKVG